MVPISRHLEKKDWVSHAVCCDVPATSACLARRSRGIRRRRIDKAAALVVCSNLAGSAVVQCRVRAQSNLAISPILYFGTPIRSRGTSRSHLGETVGAYALSESDRGPTRWARLPAPTGGPMAACALTGEKMWITNGGFADLFIVFAKIDGEQFTAFIVERGFRSDDRRGRAQDGAARVSTTPLVLQDAQIPAANLLGEPGKGHKVAFNVLNFGRYKLGAMCVGGATVAIGESARYAAARRQFGRPIANSAPSSTSLPR